MFLKLTNANPELDGVDIILNAASIVTGFEQRLLADTPNETTVTNLFCPPHGTWSVKERLADILTALGNDVAYVRAPATNGHINVASVDKPVKNPVKKTAKV